MRIDFDSKHDIKKALSMVVYLFDRDKTADRLVIEIKRARPGDKAITGHALIMTGSKEKRPARYPEQVAVFDEIFHRFPELSVTKLAQMTGIGRTTLSELRCGSNQIDKDRVDTILVDLKLEDDNDPLVIKFLAIAKPTAK